MFEGDNARECFSLIAEVAKVGIGAVQQIAVRRERLESDHGAAVANAVQRADQNALDPGEHRGVDGDAESERGDHDDRKRRPL